ncbi:MAG TPA: ABC transporter permease [Cyclobacteriaceae bacterium]|nr:ABC transporter permease [Cyclobacteriaceae bacterium]
MLYNYLKIAIRSLLKSKIHSAINIFGLGIGIACCVLIVLFVKDEWTFDSFHTKANRIYRVWAKEDYGKDEQFFYTVTPFPMAAALKENFEEVDLSVGVHSTEGLIRLGDDQFSEEVYLVGAHFFDIFDFEVLKGNTNGVLSTLDGLVLSERIAVKYFGDADPINKIVSIQIADRFEDFSVKAVLKNMPSNSSFQFDILISDLNNNKVYSERSLGAWFNIVPETYVLLTEQAKASALTPKFGSVFKKIMGPDFEGTYEVGLQPLLDIHLNTDFPIGRAPVSNPRYTYILGGIAILILVVACINFVTLSVGRSLKRAKEVGVRKVVGAERKHLIFQFIGEAVIVTIVSLVVGMIVAVTGLPTFNDLSGKGLVLEISEFMVLLGLFLVLIIGLFAGSYPAFVLSSFRPVSVLKGGVNVGGSKQRLRKILVGVQLVLSVFLISSTLIMRDQLNFLQNKDLGFNKEQLMVVQLNVVSSPDARMSQRLRDGFTKLEQFKIELAKVQGMSAVFGAAQDFGHGNWINIGYTDNTSTYRQFNLNVVDEDYIPGMKMEMVAGRNFSKEIPADKRRSIIVNEAFVREYGWTDPIGQRIPGNNFGDHEVIGVVKDFNYNSLYTRVDPVVLVTDFDVIRSGVENINVSSTTVPKLMARLNPGNIANTIGEIKSVWDRITNGEEFNFSFADESMAAQYRTDQNLSKIISIATLLAIIIGSLGLYALASLAMQNRTKEISIRKVMGATEQSLLVLLSKDYVYLIGISLLVSVPLTVYIMNNWLQTFEYNVGISWQVFAIAGALSLLIAILTISNQAVRTARSQPAQTLKSE